MLNFFDFVATQIPIQHCLYIIRGGCENGVCGQYQLSRMLRVPWFSRIKVNIIVASCGLELTKNFTKHVAADG